MKAGLTLMQMAEDLQAKAALRRDYVIDSRDVKVLTSEEGGMTVSVPTPDEGRVELFPQHLFHRQLGQAIKLRADQYDRLRDKHPMLFDPLVNGLLDRIHLEAEGNDKKPVKKMVRAYATGGPHGEGVARAMLSNRYRRFDNYELLTSVLPIIQSIPNVEIPVCEVTETKMYVKVIAPNLKVNLNDLIDPSKHITPPDTEDYVQGGFVLTNSEVGAAALSIEHMLFRLVCFNGMIVGKAIRRNHVGRQLEAGEDYSIYSDETVAADDKAVMLKVRDAVTHAVNETKFEQLARQFAATKTTEPVEHPKEAVQLLSNRVGFSDTEGESILDHLKAGGDLSQFGMVNAITRAAHDVESYDRSIEMEQTGGVVMGMGEAQWGELVAA